MADAFEGCTQPLDGGSGSQVSRVGLEGHAEGVKGFEGVPVQEVLRFAVDDGALLCAPALNSTFVTTQRSRPNDIGERLQPKT